MIEPIPLIAYPELEEQAEAVHRDGYAYLPGILDAGEIQRLRAAMDALEAIPESFDRVRTPEKGGFFNKSINNVFNRDPLFTGFLDRPRVIELAEALHGPDCHCIGMTAWMTGPGRPEQNLHADWQPLVVPEDLMEDPRLRIPVYITTAHYYLDDLYEELGPTAFVPGSHRAGRPPDGDTGYKGSAPKGIFCNAGDVVIFRSEVWHQGTANTSDQMRYLLQVHYAQRIITQKYPPYLNRFRFDPDILARATPRQLRLMGDHKRSNYD